MPHRRTVFGNYRELGISIIKGMILPSLVIINANAGSDAPHLLCVFTDAGSTCLAPALVLLLVTLTKQEDMGNILQLRGPCFLT